MGDGLKQDTPCPYWLAAVSFSYSLHGRRVPQVLTILACQMDILKGVPQCHLLGVLIRPEDPN